MPKTTAQCLDALFEYLGDERWDLGELMVDTFDGAEIMNSTTAELIEDLINSMPEPDNLTNEDIARHIHEVGTPFAVSIAQDIRSAE